MQSQRFDVVIIGGSLAGAAAATLLLRGRPGLRVAVVEKSESFPRRVGESTVEVSSYFLSRVLGLTSFINETQLTKHGMRFWFANDRTDSLPDCSELGGRYLSRLPAWQVDRSTLDEEVLRRAVGAGTTLFRPAKVRGVRLEEGGMQRVTVEGADGPVELEGRWVIDASGFSCLLSRQEGWLRPNTAHPTTACWARWKGVTDWDCFELAQRFPDWSMACHGIRNTATNHVVGDGWWAWFIPLKGGDTSVGVVFDQRRMTWPSGPEPLGQRLKAFLCRHPVAREILKNAEPVEGDVRWRANLAYTHDRIAGDGYVLTGDAAGFIDPFYSPGMDWLSYTTTRAVELVQRSLAGEPAALLARDHNADFSRSYRRWFEAVYQDKYAWMGDFELMQIGFRLDLGLYYMGVVSQPLRDGAKAYRHPVFSLSTSEIPYRLMSAYNRRLGSIAESRRIRGVFGASNDRRRFLLNGFLPDRSTGGAVLGAIVDWLVLELREGWRTWFSARPGNQKVPAPKSFAAQEMAPAVPAR
jgi:flavin-dependent dehydrogenase